MRLEGFGVLFLIVGMAILIIYAMQFTRDWLMTLGVIILIIGGITVNYKKIIG
jgi:uncharacterized membrane protein YqjE